MNHHYAIRRLSDGAIICQGTGTVPPAEMTAPDGHEVLPYRVPGELRAMSQRDADALARLAMLSRPADRDSAVLTSRTSNDG
jgi:hypothetical protein